MKFFNIFKFTVRRIRTTADAMGLITQIKEDLRHVAEQQDAEGIVHLDRAAALDEQAEAERLTAAQAINERNEAFKQLNQIEKVFG